MKVIWTPRAYESWLEAAKYIKKEFGWRALEKFRDSTLQWEEILATMPQTGHREPLLEGMKKTYRSVVINKKNKLIYTIEEDCIKIDDFWDTRREPNKQREQINVPH